MDNTLSHLQRHCTTTRQAEVLAAVEQHGGIRAAARALGIQHSHVSKVIATLHARATLANDQPDHALMDHTLAPGMALKRVSAHHGKDGSVSGWVIAEPDKQAALEAIIGAIESAAEGIKPFKRVPQPKRTDADLLTLYTLTDFHLGMYAWGEETGDDWDMDIAEAVLLNGIADMIDRSPAAETAMFLQLGDFLHWDGLLALTPASKHVLDADTRYDKLADLALEVMIKAVDMMLRKHKTVLVYNCEGNHDPAGSVWLRKAISVAFRNNPRAIVDNTPSPYYAHLHGETMIGAHHGHLRKMDSLPGLFAADPRFREMWGKATRTYIHTGHLHHKRVVEDAGAVVEQHPTLAGRDAYAARGGYVSSRAATAITYHRADGEVCRASVVPRVGGK